jgi:hypothetical protein
LIRQKCSKNDPWIFIYNFERDTTEEAENGDFEIDAAKDEAHENGDSGREEADNEALASEGEVDGATVSYIISSPPADQRYSNLEVALQTIQEFTKEYGCALTTLLSKRKGAEVYMVYQQCNLGKFPFDLP